MQKQAVFSKQPTPRNLKLTIGQNATVAAGHMTFSQTTLRIQDRVLIIFHRPNESALGESAGRLIPSSRGKHLK